MWVVLNKESKAAREALVVHTAVAPAIFQHDHIHIL